MASGRRGGSVAPAARMTVVAILAALTLTALSPVLRNGFVSYDDGPYITENAQVLRGLTGEGLGWALASLEEANWHPLTWLSHMLDVQLWGLNPRGHHAVSLLLHASNAVLLFLVLAGLTGAFWPSAVVAALFAVHPLHVEPVAWAAERKEVLSFLLFVAALAAYRRYVRRPGAGRFALVGLCFALGLMAKPMLVTLPLLLLLLDYWPLGRTAAARVRPGVAGRAAPWGIWQRLALEKLPLFALAMASGVITLVAQSRGGALSSTQILPFPQRLANAATSYGRYLVKALWPADLAVFYPHPQAEGSWAWSAGAAVALAVVTFLALRARRPALVVGWFWYLGTLVPVIGLVQAGVQALADRYTYLPLTGLFIMVAWGFARASRRLQPWLVAATGAALLGFSALTFVQAGTWRSSLTLFRHALAVTDRNAVAHNGLGNVHYRAGQLADAEQHYRQAVRFEPENPEYAFNLGLALSQRGELRAAEASFRRALLQGADQPLFHNSLGRVLQRQGNFAEASAHYRRAMELDASYLLPRINEGSLQLQLKNYQAAVAPLREAARLQPANAEIRAALAAAESGLP